MKEFKGTPGPWTVVGACCDAVGADFDSGGYKSVCQRPARTGGKLTDEYNANMHLISAAPELLEALTSTLDEIGFWLSQQKPELRDKLVSAVEKALGESK